MRVALMIALSVTCFGCGDYAPSGTTKAERSALSPRFGNASLTPRFGNDRALSPPSTKE